MKQKLQKANGKTSATKSKLKQREYFDQEEENFDALEMEERQDP